MGDGSWRNKLCVMERVAADEGLSVSESQGFGEAGKTKIGKNYGSGM